MELLQLTYFCDAAESENFSKTAEKYFVPPSNISQSVKRLEAELGVPLFSRNANRVRLNNAGRAFYEEARQALLYIEKAKAAVALNGTPESIRINIHIDRRVVMQVVERFRVAYPSIAIAVTHGSRTDLSDFDIVVSDRPTVDTDFTSERVAEEAIVLAGRQDVFPASMDAETLREMPFITMSRGNSLYAITEEICAAIGFRPCIALESEDPFYIRKCVELGLGLAFVPALSWKGQLSRNIVMKSPVTYMRNIYVSVRRDRSTPAYVDNFRRMLVEEFQK